MNYQDWMNVASSSVFLAISVMAALRAKTTPLAPALSQVCAGLFAYQLFEILHHVTGRYELLCLEYAAAALVAPATGGLVLQFVGHWRRLRLVVLAGLTYFLSIAAICLAGVFWPRFLAFPESVAYGWAMLFGLVPEIVLILVLLLRHASRADAKERARTRLLGLALVLGVGGASSDLASIAGANVPRVAAFGLIAAAILLALLCLRFSFLEGVTGLVAANVGAVACLLVLGNLLLADWAGASSTPLIVMSLALTIATVATLRPMTAAISESRARARYLQTLGRFSAQMAHDLMNPLSAIRGAAQYLVEERRRGASLDDQTAFVELILEQSDRLARVVTDYQRLGRAEAILKETSLRALVGEVAAAQRTARRDHTIEVSLEEGLDLVRLDRDLVAGALENLVKNAQEAKGTRVLIGAARSVGGTSPRVRIWVEDDGLGMDERTRESALDEFFTTKPGGTGLGLAFVGRVAEAHGGRVRLLSGAQGKGTRVELELVA